MAERKLDLFGFLGKLSSGDHSCYDKLDDDQKKEVAPFVLMRWMTGTRDAAQIIRLNTVANPYMFSLGSEKPLLAKLLVAGATQNSSRYSWLKGPGSKSPKLKLNAICEYYGVSLKEAKEYIVDDESLIEMAGELGWDDEQLKKLKAEIKK